MVVYFSRPELHSPVEIFMKEENTKMKAIHLTSYGDPTENLKVVDIPEPKAPSPGEALIRVEYAPVHPSDLYLASGIYLLRPELPSVIGGEGAGIVEAVGSGVTQVKVGDRVTLPFKTFSWAEKVLTRATELQVVPKSIDAKTASMLSINPTTAVLLLNEFTHLKAKDWIVLNAANSRVAGCIIAISKARGINVAAIVRRPEVVSEIKQLGADFVGIESPDLPKQIQAATDGMPILLGLDAVGGPATATIANVLAPKANLVVYAWLGGVPIQISPADLIVKRLQIHGFWMYYDEFLPKLRAATAEAMEVIASGKLKLSATAVYKPSEIQEAIEHTQKGGKALLDFNQ
jgi:NADPH:quinone reductase-like Zn-dependent oxidoreductase